MLFNYYFFPKIFTDSECDSLLEVASNVSQTFKDQPGTGKKVRTDVVESDKISNELKKFFNLVDECNECCYGYELFDKRPRTVNFNYYSNDTNEYPYHRDMAEFGQMYDIKLTAVLNLSKEKYVGGDFELFTGDHTHIHPFHERGTLLVFPSMLYHRVKPVTEGERITLSCWFTGPNWR